MYLGHSGPLDKIVKFPCGRIFRQVLEIIKERLQLSFKKPSVELMFQLLVPERSDVYLDEGMIKKIC